MSPLPRILVWFSRIHKCLGFGIQSPTDYDFVRTVVNEYDAYYAYDEQQADNWMQRKLGRLYFRVSNWRQPATILTNDYQPWFLAGCRSARLSPVNCKLSTVNIDLVRIEIDDWSECSCMYSCLLHKSGFEIS